MNFLEIHKQIWWPFRKSRHVSSSCSDSDFWALGHVRNSRVSSIVNLQCHFIWFLQCVVGFWGLSPQTPLYLKDYIYTCIYFMSIIYPPHLFYIYVIVLLFHKSTYLRPFFLSVWHQWMFWKYTNKSLGPIGILVWEALAQIQISGLLDMLEILERAALYLHCHLTQGINTYHV